MSAMHQAARANDVEGMQQLLVSGRHDINERDGMKRTPLAIACWAGHVEIVKLLLRNKAKPNALASDNFTALHFASNVDIIKELVKKDKQLVKARVSKGNKTALHLAIPKGNVDVIACLLDVGSDITAKTGAGKSCLELAQSDDVYALLKARYQERLDRLQATGNPLSAKEGTGVGEGDVEEDDRGMDQDQGDGADAANGRQRAVQPTTAVSSCGSSSSVSSTPACTSLSTADAGTATIDNVQLTANDDSCAVGLPSASTMQGMPPSLLGARTATEAGMQQQQKQRKMRMKAAAAGSIVKLSHLGDDDEEG